MRFLGLSLTSRQHADEDTKRRMMDKEDPLANHRQFLPALPKFQGRQSMRLKPEGK
jgi:hypothetical protein